jgi:hypothetical protein
VAFRDLIIGANNTIFQQGGTERARIDSSGNLGLGVVPSGWGGGAKALQINSTASAWGVSNAFYLGNNEYFDGANRRYLVSGLGATELIQANGSYIFQIAPSGTAGNAISWTQAMTLDASGNLGIGMTSPGRRLDVQGPEGTAFQFLETSSGSTRRIQLGTDTNVGFINTDAGAGAIALSLRVTGTERARIDSSGNLIQTVNTAAATLTTNQTLTFSIVNNSTLRISVRGSDGTTRTATVALT